MLSSFANNAELQFTVWTTGLKSTPDSELKHEQEVKQSKLLRPYVKEFYPLTATVRLGRHLMEAFDLSALLTMSKCGKCRSNVFWGLWDTELDALLLQEENMSWGAEWKDVHIP